MYSVGVCAHTLWTSLKHLSIRANAIALASRGCGFHFLPIQKREAAV